MGIKERLEAPVPKVFRVLRTIGLTCAAIGAAVLATPVAFPAIMVSIAGYLTLFGTVLGGVSQATVSGEK